MTSGGMLLFSISMRALAFRGVLRRRGVEFFEHRHAQPRQGVCGFMILSALIVAQDRKDQPPPAGSFGKTGKRAHVLDRAGLRVNVPGRSEERRVGKECRCGWWADEWKR